jgi:hypothetical protein
MALYTDNINPDNYKYMAPIYLTEISGQNKVLFPIKINLTASSFNFELTRSDGTDLRLAERSNGTGVFNMWIAYWNYSDGKATVWFKIPELLANETRTLWLFWGAIYDTGVSDLNEIADSFLLADDFDSLNTSVWSSNGSYTISNSAIDLGIDSYIQCNVLNPLSGIKSWIVEEGITGIGSPGSTSVYAHRYYFLGGENSFEFRFYWNGATDREHSAIDGNLIIDNGDDKGLEVASYSQNYISYIEDTDRVYQGMANRNTYADYDDSWERSVHRNTTPTYFRIYGEDQSVGNGVEIDWIVVREYDPSSEPTIDISEIYIGYEYIAHQLIDTNSY